MTGLNAEGCKRYLSLNLNASSTNKDFNDFEHKRTGLFEVMQVTMN